VAVSGEVGWPPLGRNRWPLTFDPLHRSPVRITPPHVRFVGVATGDPDEIDRVVALLRVDDNLTRLHHVTKPEQLASGIRYLDLGFLGISRAEIRLKCLAIIRKLSEVAGVHPADRKNALLHQGTTAGMMQCPIASTLRPGQYPDGDTLASEYDFCAVQS
jgi:hypothetical protein